MNFQKQLQHISRNEGGEGGQRQFGAFHPFLREYAPLNHHPFLYISRKSHNTRAWWVRLLRSSKEIVVALSLLLQLLQQRGHLMPSTPPFTPQLFPLSPNLPPGDRVELNIEVILEIFFVKMQMFFSKNFLYLRCLCKFFLSGVKFSLLNMKMVHVFYKRCVIYRKCARQCMIFMV